MLWDSLESGEQIVPSVLCSKLVCPSGQLCENISVHELALIHAT